jgi:hypothetical protein
MPSYRFRVRLGRERSVVARCAWCTMPFVEAEVDPVTGKPFMLDGRPHQRSAATTGDDLHLGDQATTRRAWKRRAESGRAAWQRIRDRPRTVRGRRMRGRRTWSPPGDNVATHHGAGVVAWLRSESRETCLGHCPGPLPARRPARPPRCSPVRFASTRTLATTSPTCPGVPAATSTRRVKVRSAVASTLWIAFMVLCCTRGLLANSDGPGGRLAVRTQFARSGSSRELLNHWSEAWPSTCLL